MTPIQALDLLAQQIGRMTGSRNDHMTLMSAENVLRGFILSHQKPDSTKKIQAIKKLNKQVIPADSPVKGSRRA